MGAGSPISLNSLFYGWGLATSRPLNILAIACYNEKRDEIGNNRLGKKTREQLHERGYSAIKATRAAGDR